MEYNRIIAVTGLPGLFELVASKTDGAIVRSLDDKSTKFVSSRVHNFSHLESIEIYTVRDNVNLVEIFQAMEKSKTKLPDGKDAGALKDYFGEVYPDMDFERVYSSDMKKMVKWFESLQKSGVEIKLSERAEEEADEDADAEEEVAEVTEAKPKAAKKKASSETEAAKDDKAVAKEKAPAKASAAKESAAKESATKEKAPKKADADDAETEESAAAKPKKAAKKK